MPDIVYVELSSSFFQVPQSNWHTYKSSPQHVNTKSRMRPLISSVDLLHSMVIGKWVKIGKERSYLKVSDERVNRSCYSQSSVSIINQLKLRT